MPFLLRCWLISSIGEGAALARSRWSKGKPRLREIRRRGLSHGYRPQLSNSYYAGGLSLYFPFSSFGDEGSKSTVPIGIRRVTSSSLVSLV